MCGTCECIQQKADRTRVLVHRFMAAGTQGRRRVLSPGEAEPPHGFYENRSHRPSNHTKLRATERIYKSKGCSLYVIATLGA
jgi:hypothetical protein